MEGYFDTEASHSEPYRSCSEILSCLQRVHAYDTRKSPSCRLSRISLTSVVTYEEEMFSSKLVKILLELALTP